MAASMLPNRLGKPSSCWSLEIRKIPDSFTYNNI
jgi:hypothetical protein